MPDPIKVSPTYEEDEEIKRSPSTDEEESKGGKLRGLRERRAGFFRQHPRAKWIIAIVALVLIAAGLYVWHYYSTRESTDDAQINGHIYPISARVSGTTLRVLHDDNDFVNKGDLLVELDPRDYQIAVDRAKADLATAEANAVAAHVGVPLTTTTSTGQLQAADAALVAAQKEVQAAQARVQEAQANYTKVSADLNRMKALVEKDEVSRQQYDAAVAAASAAKATLDASNAGVASAESRAAQAKAQAQAAHTVPEQVRAMRAKAGAASAEVQMAQAALQQAELNMQYTKIVAPVTGVLSKRNVEVGQVVQAGQPLFSIVDLDNIWVTANFKETQLKNMRPGQPAEIHVDAYGRDYKGTVSSIAGASGALFSLLPPENATGNYVKVVQRIPVRIDFAKGQDPNHLLRPGMSVEPTVFVKQ
ncbi:MAG TPA: HlyD family secretion protein [Candidatus Angelobacter sp.]|nr:HlyD family secretion protein [Candidatus Angelobacter sp.]HEX5435067.1 HlyD family secretion protein [Candidatus Angelobacter sp.]